MLIKGVKLLRKKKVFFSANFGIGATILIGQEMLFLPYAFFVVVILTMIRRPVLKRA